jgi:hypothetical protein
MMTSMMNGSMGMPMMGGMILSILFWLLLLVVLLWALMSWLNRQWERPQPVPPLCSYHPYEQGYHVSVPLKGSDWEGERSAQPKQEFEQPYASYPFEQQMPPQL